MRPNEKLVHPRCKMYGKYSNSNKTMFKSIERVQSLQFDALKGLKTLEHSDIIPTVKTRNIIFSSIPFSFTLSGSGSGFGVSDVCLYASSYKCVCLYGVNMPLCFSSKC